MWYKQNCCTNSSKFSENKIKKYSISGNTVFSQSLIRCKSLYKQKFCNRMMCQNHVWKTKHFLLPESLKYCHECSDCGLHVCIILTDWVNNEQRKWCSPNIGIHIQYHTLSKHWWLQSQHCEHVIWVLWLQCSDVWHTNTILKKCIAFNFKVEGAGCRFFQKVDIPSQTL